MKEEVLTNTPLWLTAYKKVYLENPGLQSISGGWKLRTAAISTGELSKKKYKGVEEKRKFW